jgi:16S rRNA G527 N7-methylase RsmG
VPQIQSRHSGDEEINLCRNSNPDRLANKHIIDLSLQVDILDSTEHMKALNNH